MEDRLATILEAIETLSKKIEALNGKSEQKSESDKLDLLFTALAKAQSEMPIAGLTSTNPYFKSKYADLAEFVRASRPYLTKNGLTVVQKIISDDGPSILYTKLGHSSGQWLESRMRIVPPKNDIQTLGSYITYLKRYSYASLVGVVSGQEDDDGEIAMVNTRDVIAKGPSIKYNPKDQSFDTITREQLDEMEYELSEYPDIADQVLNGLQIQSLADCPKSKYQVSMTRIREIKKLRNEGVKG